MSEVESEVIVIAIFPVEVHNAKEKPKTGSEVKDGGTDLGVTCTRKV